MTNKISPLILNITWFRVSLVKEIMNMKKLNVGIAILVAAVMAGNAQTSSNTLPVGYVTHKVKASTDQRLGVPMQRASTLVSQSTTVNSTTVTAPGITPITGAHFLLVTSGTAIGKWEEISTSSTGSLNLVASIPGFANGDSFEIKPFWTLGTLLPNGGGVPASADPFDPVALVLFYNPEATGVNIASSKAYLYHSGSDDYAAGWYDNDDLDAGTKENVVFSPEVGFAIRNASASEISIPMVGNVPSEKIALDVVRTSSTSQDNIVYNKFPADITLGTSGLAPSVVLPSTDIFDPGDLVLTFNLNATGYNLSASAAYFYFAGDADNAEGWYDSGDVEGGVKNNVVIPAGAQIVIRKARGSAGAVAWNPDLPYNL